MSTREIALLAQQWGEINLGQPTTKSRQEDIIRELRQGTPERQAHNVALFMDYLPQGWQRSIFLRILQSEAERSEV